MTALHPLNDLINSKSDIQMLHYPSDLGSSRKGHWLNFYISVPQKAIAKSKITTMAGTQAPNDILLNGAQTTIPGQNSAQNLTVEQKAQELFYQYTVLPGSTKLVSTISLYMPDTLSVSQLSQYGAIDLTTLLGTLGLVSEAAISAADLARGKEIKESLKNLGTETVAKLGSQYSYGNAVGPALKTIGSAVNPQMELLFNRIDFRTYQFEFLFTPKSQSEAVIVSDIIKAFKFHAAPDIDSSSSGRYFVVPSVFEIEAFFQNGPNKFVNKFAVSALESVFVDYAPQGWVTHQDGSPVQTRMTLKFKEMDIMTKSKIDQGY